MAGSVALPNWSAISVGDMRSATSALESAGSSLKGAFTSASKIGEEYLKNSIYNAELAKQQRSMQAANQLISAGSVNEAKQALAGLDPEAAYDTAMINNAYSTGLNRGTTLDTNTNTSALLGRVLNAKTPEEARAAAAEMEKYGAMVNADAVTRTTQNSLTGFRDQAKLEADIANNRDNLSLKRQELALRQAEIGKANQDRDYRLFLDQSKYLRSLANKLDITPEQRMEYNKQADALESQALRLNLDQFIAPTSNTAVNTSNTVTQPSVMPSVNSLGQIPTTQGATPEVAVQGSTVTPSNTPEMSAVDLLKSRMSEGSINTSNIPTTTMQRSVNGGFVDTNTLPNNLSRADAKLNPTTVDKTNSTTNMFGLSTDKTTPAITVSAVKPAVDVTQLGELSVANEQLLVERQNTVEAFKGQLTAAVKEATARRLGFTDMASFDNAINSGTTAANNIKKQMETVINTNPEYIALTKQGKVETDILTQNAKLYSRIAETVTPENQKKIEKTVVNYASGLRDNKLATVAAPVVSLVKSGLLPLEVLGTIDDKKPRDSLRTTLLDAYNEYKNGGYILNTDQQKAVAEVTRNLVALQAEDKEDDIKSSSLQYMTDAANMLNRMITDSIKPK